VTPYIEVKNGIAILKANAGTQKADIHQGEGGILKPVTTLQRPDKDDLYPSELLPGKGPHQADNSSQRKNAEKGGVLLVLTES